LERASQRHKMIDVGTYLSLL